MANLPLFLLVVPLATAVVVALIGLLAPRPAEGEGGRGADGAIRWITLASTLVSLALAAVLAWDQAAHAASQEGKQPVAEEADFHQDWLSPTFEPRNATAFNVLKLAGPREGAPAVQLYLGVDGLNVWLVLLTALLVVPSVLVSWRSITERVPEFHAWLMVLQLGMVGVFLAFDIILFYVFFELTLVPLFFLIGIWGGPQRQYAAYKFFLFTLAGSLFTLLGVLGIVLTLANDGPDKQVTFALPELVRSVGRHGRKVDKDLAAARQRAEEQGQAEKKAADRSREKSRQLEKAKKGGDEAAVNAADAALKQAEEAPPGAPPAPGKARKALESAQSGSDHWQRVQFWVFLAMMAGFAVKVPLLPVHTWLPLAHTEAPTAGSVLLAGVLLKIGGYGFLRLCLPLAPDASLRVGAPLLCALAAIGIVYGAFCALAQHDIKKLVAYSSVSHMGYVVLGLFSLNEIGLSGGLLQMINHGLSTGALFLLVGMLYERYHTRKMSDYGGLGKKLGLLAAFFVFITMSSIGLPGLNGFVGEALVLMGIFSSDGGTVDGRLLAAVGTVGVLLGAWYMLTLVMRVFFGEVREPTHEGGHGPVPDLGAREVVTLAPIALCCLALGLYPKPFLDTVRPDVRVVADISEGARQRLANHARQAEKDKASSAQAEE